MKRSTRIPSTSGTGDDARVKRFENKDAIAQAALLEARDALDKVRTRHAALQKSVMEIRDALQSRQDEAEQLAVQAERLSPISDLKAQQCLQRSRVCTQQIQELKRNLKKHQAIELDMGRRMLEMENRLQAMHEQVEAAHSGD